MKTIITIRKADGTEKTVEREGVFGAEKRVEWAANAAAKFGVEVVKWETVYPQPVRPVIVSGRARQRYNRYNAQRSNSANAQVCRGCGRRGDDGECGLGHY